MTDSAFVYTDDFAEVETEPQAAVSTAPGLGPVYRDTTPLVSRKQRIVGAAIGVALGAIVGFAVGRAVYSLSNADSEALRVVLVDVMPFILALGLGALGWFMGGERFGFTAPAIVVLVAFVFVPIAYAFVLATFQGTRWTPMQDFVGFQNFIDIFSTRREDLALGQPFFWDAVRNNFFIAAISILIQAPIALGVALLLNRKIKFRGVIRLLIFVPYVLSEVITGVMFSLLLMPTGAVNYVLVRMGEGIGGPIGRWLEGFASMQWLMDTSPVTDPGFFAILGSRTFWIIFAIMTWKYVGLAIILFLAGLSGIPDELTEAAEVDGASWWQTQRRITIPLLGPTVRIWAFLSLIGSFQLFDMIWIMTNQSPGRVGLHTMATFMVDQGINRGQVGFGSAVAVILFVITLTLALTYQRFLLRRDIGNED